MPCQVRVRHAAAGPFIVSPARPRLASTPGADSKHKSTTPCRRFLRLSAPPTHSRHSSLSVTPPATAGSGSAATSACAALVAPSRCATTFATFAAFSSLRFLSAAFHSASAFADPETSGSQRWRLAQRSSHQLLSWTSHLPYRSWDPTTTLQKQDNQTVRFVDRHIQ
jgi:hypothetical protein